MKTHLVFTAMQDMAAIKRGLLRLLDGMRGRGRPPNGCFLLPRSWTAAALMYRIGHSTLTNRHLTVPHTAVIPYVCGRFQEAHGVRAGRVGPAPWARPGGEGVMVYGT